MKIFGILNVTPDSFSDGGLNFEASSAIKSAEKMLEDGVFAIDIGAESTRPNAQIISSEEEIARLSGILPKIVKMGAKVSLDTRNFETAKWGLENGVSIINDVSGFSDVRTMKLLKEFDATGVFMHSLTVPANPEITMNSETFIEEIIQFAKAKILDFHNLGIPSEKLIFDAGIGFGKTAKQSIFLMQNMEKFNSLGVQILAGHSRKSFLKEAFKERFAEGEPSLFEKDLMTSIFSILMLEKVDFLRLHNASILHFL